MTDREVNRDNYDGIGDDNGKNIEGEDDTRGNMVSGDEDAEMIFGEEDPMIENDEEGNSQKKIMALEVENLDPLNDVNYLWGDTPKLGMEFETVDEAYSYYNAYGKSKGFSIRINNTSLSRRRDKAVLMRRLCCSKEGKRRSSLQFNSPKKPRPITRIDCRAHFVVRLQKDNKYKLTDFIEEHNHDLAKPSEAHMLRPRRRVKGSQGGVIVDMHNAGIGAKKKRSYLRAEAGGSQNLNLTKDGCTSYVQRHRREVIKDGDAHTVLKYFMQMKKNDPSFFYTYKLDENHQVASCFWCDARSRVDYSFFSDVLCFDTTYKTNGYDLPYAPFVGVNHHGQSILFGCGLIFNESTESFIWLFEAFLKAMGGKTPMTIFTDQAQVIGNAIRYVFPDSHHRLCLWHIYQNAGKHLSCVYEGFKSFQKSFHDVVYNNETEEEFEAAWSKLIKDYSLEGNSWLDDLYSKKEQWALVYGRQHFCAGITTTQRSESMNSYFKRYLHRKMLLYEFARKYDEAVLDRREEEISQDLKSRQNVPTLKSRWKVEKEASEKYTMELFSRFQQQLVECWNLFDKQVEVKGTTITYNVSSYGDCGQRIVTFDTLDNTVNCGCKLFEFTGILCSHALKVLHTRQVQSLPPLYYLRRWTKDATSGMVMKSGLVLNACGTGLQADPESTFSSRYSKLVHVALAFAVKAATINESYELGMKELMEGLRKIDICLETNGGKLKKVTEIGEENDTLEEEPTIKVKNPPHKKDKDTSYGRRTGALEKSKKSAKVQQNPRKRQATNQKKNQGQPPMESDILPPSTTSAQVVQQLFPQTSHVEGAHNPQFGDYGSISMNARLGVESVYNPHIHDTRSMSMMHSLDPPMPITETSRQVAQWSIPQTFQVQNAQNVPNVNYNDIAKVSPLHHQVSFQVRGDGKSYFDDSGNMNVLPSPVQGAFNRFYRDSTSMTMTPSRSQSFQHQDPLVAMSDPLLQPAIDDMQSNRIFLSLSREDGMTRTKK